MLCYESDKPADDFQSLQEVQSWRLVQFNGKEVKVVHCEEICVVLSVAQTGIKRLELSLFENEKEPAFQKNIKAFLFDRMKLLLEQGQKEGVYVDVPVRPVFLVLFASLTRVQALLRKITAMWATASRLIEEFSLVHKRFPLETRLLAKKSRPASFLRVAARVHCETTASSFFVQFELTGEETVSAALEDAVCDIGCGVEVQFGQIE